MSFTQVYTRSVVGLHAPKFSIEEHLSQGLLALAIVGLPEAAVRESKDRVRSAILNSGFQFPNRRLTINLARAIKAESLAIKASEKLKKGEKATANETDLNQSISATSPITPQLIVPNINGAEASRVEGIEVLGTKSLKAVCDHLQALTNPNASYESLIT